MDAQLILSLVIFIVAILGCGGYFMYMEFKMAGFNNKERTWL